MDKLPLNWELMKSPLNWLTVVLMVMISTFAIDAIMRVKSGSPTT